jgi:hypothetical protein
MKNKIIQLIFGSVLTVASITLIAVLLQWLWGIGNDLQLATTYTMATVVPIVASFFLLVWGLPTHFLLSKLNKTKARWYSLAGFVPAPIFVFGFKPMGEDPILGLIYQSSYFGLISAIGATIFWFYVVKNSS